jgi:hypothetical protein
MALLWQALSAIAGILSAKIMSSVVIPIRPMLSLHLLAAASPHQLQAAL